MSKTIVYGVDVQFGDCDPAGIVFFPNYSRWMDAASHQYFVACGLPPWREMAQLPGCIGAPLLEIHTRFHAAVTYGERIDFATCIEEWRGKVFIQRHRVTRGDALICEGRETRALCVLDGGGKLKAVPVPDFIRSACEGSPQVPFAFDEDGSR
ncbi:MAG: acyl-CoA thioesterase [Burkholderiales bacterium]|nr:acyl-CoA thioesterase [Burkholderiales bacterium]MDE1926181.1 acyl-CoA thioesterase [Burkholderiales bacterium]MDE2161113.1 acyl-CoA thioesterase [Burkholderiales bacterium]MDE2501857.1 acyl-CoA thioesterase [Burkholderiales bacterium]